MNKTKKLKTLKLGLICFFIGVGLASNLTGCSKQGATTDAPTTESTPTEETTTAAPTTEAVPEETTLAVGEKTTLGDWEITLDSFKVTAEIQNTFGSFSADEGNKFVVTTLTVKNNGTQSDTFMSSFPVGNKDVVSKIFYKGTYEFSGSNLLGHKEDLHNQSLNPLSSLTGIMAYEVADEAAESDELVLTLTLGDESVTYALK